MTYLILFILVLVDAFSIFFCIYIIREILLLSNMAPYIRTRASAMEEIVSAIGALPADSVFFDLGCGDGRVLCAVADKNPNSTYRGVDIRLLPYWLAKRGSRGRGNMSFAKGDFFSQDLTSATHVYTYLYPNVMRALHPKLRRELKPGTILYSLDFTFDDKEPIRTIELSNPQKHMLAKKLYVYQF